jgi:hypothetical protein
MKTKLKRFLDALDYCGEYYFSYGSIKKDYEFITSVLKSQGYWAGVNYRLYFDDSLNLINIEERF